MTEAQHIHLLAIIGMASETNNLVNAMQVPVDREFLVDKVSGWRASCHTCINAALTDPIALAEDVQEAHSSSSIHRPAKTVATWQLTTRLTSVWISERWGYTFGKDQTT